MSEQIIADHGYQDHYLGEKANCRQPESPEELLKLDVILVPEAVEVVREPPVNLC
jgi:hypothetical protein